MKKHNRPLIGGRHISYFDGIYNVDFYKKVINDRNFIEFFKHDSPNFDVINTARLKELDEVSFDNFSDFERDIICQDKYRNMMDNDSDIQNIHFKYEEWLKGKLHQEICIFEIINPDSKEEVIAYMRNLEAFGPYDGNLPHLS